MVVCGVLTLVSYLSTLVLALSRWCTWATVKWCVAFLLSFSCAVLGICVIAMDIFVYPFEIVVCGVAIVVSYISMLGLMCARCMVDECVVSTK